MSPEREAAINGTRIKEFYWAGDMVVYVNSRLYRWPFWHAVMAARNEPYPTA